MSETKPIEMMSTNELIEAIPESTLIGLVMKLTGGSANPNVIGAQRRRLLNFDGVDNTGSD